MRPESAYDDNRGAAAPQPATELSIIVVNWNSADFLRKCVDSIRRHTKDVSYEIIVIDNASFDGCDKTLREYAPDVIYIQSDKNLGFAKANNSAFRASRGTSVLFLNPDTEIVKPAIGILYRALQQLPTAGAVGARLLSADGELQTNCIQSFPTILNQALDSEYFRNRWPESPLWGTKALLNGQKNAEEVEGICGACLMVTRDTFYRVGGFTEDYFMYAEDMDLCHKIRKAGYRNYYVPGAEVVHFGGNSSKQAPSNFSSVMMRESTWRFLRKTRGNLYGTGYRVAMFLSAFCRLALLGISFLGQPKSRRNQVSASSFRKWWAILGWSLRRKHSLKRYC
jgi:N-acetylglucosaminyl-diphospho-decaprenol L-rhamnosyltransferase